MITLKQIEAIYWVYTLSSFSDAAKKLNTTQSALSKRVRDIEIVLDLQIFEKSSRTQLTISGRELIKDFTEILTLRKRILNKFIDPKDYSGIFRLGVTEVVALSWLPELISTIKGKYPKIIMESNVDKAKNLWRKMDSQLLDIIIVPNLGDVHEDLIGNYLCTVDCDWMISKDLLPLGSPFKLAEIFSYPLLMHSEESILYKELRKMLKRYRIEPREKIYCGSLTAMAELANNNMGLSYLPSNLSASVGRKTENLRKVDIPMKVKPLKFYAIHKSDVLCNDIVETIKPIFHDSVADYKNELNASKM